MNRFMYWLAVTVGLAFAATYAASVVYPLGKVVMVTTVAGGVFSFLAAMCYAGDSLKPRWTITLLLAIGIVFSLSSALNPSLSTELVAKLGIVLGIAAVGAMIMTVRHLIRES